MKLTDDQRIESAILFGRIGGFKHALEAVTLEILVRGDIEEVRRWLEARIQVNEVMLKCLRETGRIPEEPPHGQDG